MDVSFISATLVLPAVIAAAFPPESTARSGRELIVLVKPQFEAGRENVGKGGIVRDPGNSAASRRKSPRRCAIPGRDLHRRNRLPHPRRRRQPRIPPPRQVLSHFSPQRRRATEKGSKFKSSHGFPRINTDEPFFYLAMPYPCESAQIRGRCCLCASVPPW